MPAWEVSPPEPRLLRWGGEVQEERVRWGAIPEGLGDQDVRDMWEQLRRARSQKGSRINMGYEFNSFDKSVQEQTDGHPKYSSRDEQARAGTGPTARRLQEKSVRSWIFRRK